MVQTIQAQDITIEQLQENFGLQLTTDSQFFPEWQGKHSAVSYQPSAILFGARLKVY